MPRFHFDVIDEDCFIDDVGLVFTDVEAMRPEVMRAAGTMLSERASFPNEPWTMIVRNERRRVVATLSFTVHHPTIS